MGSSVSLPTGRTSFSVISANASAALRWRSTLSENESVVNAVSGDPVKKLVVVRSAKMFRNRTECKSLVTYSQGIEGGQQRLLVRSPIKVAHKTATCANGLYSNVMMK